MPPWRSFSRSRKRPNACESAASCVMVTSLGQLAGLLSRCMDFASILRAEAPPASIIAQKDGGSKGKDNPFRAAVGSDLVGRSLGGRRPHHAVLVELLV